MSKFKKKKGGELPPVSTASLPDIVFMLLFFFMVATVMRESELKIDTPKLPSADQIEKLDKKITMFIYAGKPSAQYKNFGTEARIQINDKFASLDAIQPAVLEARLALREELQKRFVVAFKVDEDTNTGLVSDIKQKLREINALKIMYITNVKKVE